VKLAVVTSSPPGIEGGHLVIARAIVSTARELGHDARLVVTADFGFGRTARTYAANRMTRVDDVDRVVSLRYPSFAVRHPAHVCWLTHTMREYYDLWPKFSATLSPLNTIKERTRRAVIHAADNYLLKHNVREVVALSGTVRDRLQRDFNIVADVLLPPPPPRPYRCDGYEPFVFAASRHVPLKRLDLIVRAVADPAARGMRVVIAGDGDERDALETLAEHLGVGDRVTFVGHVDDDALVEYLARCRAVAFAPFSEDYGFLAAEAFASMKPVVTCTDSGGPTELVEDGVSGFVVSPEPKAVASALARLMEDAALAERMGRCGYARVEPMTWPAAVDRLVKNR